MTEKPDKQASKDQPEQKERAPTPEEKAAAFRFLLVGAGIALAAIYFVGRILDADSQNTLLWQYGRYAAVALFAWVGHSVGLGRGRVVAENLECLAIAVVMALILKHFLIEAYKIPTGSMQPTILGNEESAIFDRVLVNKFAYLVDEPERYDVIVFKFPLDRSVNYIKRLVGLPDERVMIFAGNIYAAPRKPDGSYGPMQIARKSKSVRDAVMKRLYPSGRAGERFDTAFQVLTGSHHVDGDDIVLGADSSFRFGQNEPVRDQYLDGYDPDWGIPAPHYLNEFGSQVVSDLGIRLELTPESGCEEIRLALFVNEIEHRVVLGVGDAAGTRIESGYPAEGGLLPVGSGDTVVASSDRTWLEESRATELAFYHVDQQLVLEVDGEQVLAFEYQISDDPGGSDSPGTYPAPRGATRNEVRLENSGGPVGIEDLEILRDIHYLAQGRGDRMIFDVPADSYFVLGDNTQNSSDGRMWAAQKVTLADGVEVLREKRDHGWDTREFTDIYGETYRMSIGRQPIVKRVDTEEFSFVPGNLLLGKAIAVFWPIYPHFRWKLIR